MSTPLAACIGDSKVDQAFLAGLELLQHKVYPLPGGSIPRKLIEEDDRFAPKTMIIGGASVGPKDTDIVTLYEHVATVRHKATKQIFVAFRQSLDLLLRFQQDRTKFPKWIMELPAKRAELKVFIYRMIAHPSQFSALGTHEQWWQKWLGEVPNESHHDTVGYYLMKNMIVVTENVKELFK